VADIHIPGWMKCCAAEDDKGVRGLRSNSVCMMDVWEGQQQQRVTKQPNNQTNSEPNRTIS
jgi:hypothetical protein